MRVLGRVLVVVFENDMDEDIPDEAQAVEGETSVPTDAQLREHFAWNTLWKRSGMSTQGLASGTSQLQDETGAGADPRLPSLADNLFNCTIDLLFCAGFTVPESVRGQSRDKINVGSLQHNTTIGSFLSAVVCDLGKGRRIDAKHRFYL